jgi:plastocyanin
VRRLVPVGLAALALAVPAAADPSQRIQVVAREYSLVLSQSQLKSGRAVIELANFGQDPHNLVLRRVGRQGSLADTGVVLAGNRAELTVRLKAGIYELYCSLDDHQARGMDTLLLVKKKKR